MPIQRRPLLATLAATAVLAGCAALTPKTPEQVVAERAVERWNLLIKRDLAGAHAYYQPFFRNAFSVKDVEQADQPPSAYAVRVHNVTCQPERCTARVVFKVKAPIGRSMRAGRTMDIETFRDEDWVRENGQWWYERRAL